MATLLSVNVGLPADVAWQGRTVHTGAWKDPVDGPRMVRTLNVDGDGQGDLGGHGGENRAVLVYQLDSYRHWAAEFGRDDLLPGHFGENFTVDGLPDDEVCIGDRYRIGDAVFEVTQPRVTCYRAGLRIGVPNMAALLVSHHRPGFYLRVLTEGEVEAGQEIEKIADGPEHVTVAELDALLYLPGHPSDAAHRALRIPALSPGWRWSLERLVEQPDGRGNTGLTAAATSPPPAWQGFRRLRVTGTDDVGAHVRSLTLSDPDGHRLPPWLPGQSIVLRLGVDGATVLRNYSLCNAPDSGRYRIGVKREPDGRGSGYLHSRVAVGDALDVAAPRGTFFLSDDDRPLLLVSAGVGVTPVLSMLHALAACPREVWWVHGARDASEHAFAAEARELLDRLPRSRSEVYFSRPAPSDRFGVDYAAAGRISAATFRDVPPDAEAYLCGPADFMTATAVALVEAGLDPARVHTETFGTTGSLAPGITGETSVPPHPPEGPPGRGPDVGFARSGIDAPWDSTYASLLEFAEACDVPTRWSCRTGVCHNCETALLSGAVRYDVEPLDPPAEGNVLICCASPVDAVVLDL